jgi:hypothetical protein
MESVKAGHYNRLSPDIELPCRETAGLMSGWSQAVPFALLSYDTAMKSWPMVDSWMILAQNTAELLKVPGPHADFEGEVLEIVFAEGFSLLRDSRIHQGRSEGLDTVSGTSPDPAGIVSKDLRVAPRDYYTSANHDDLPRMQRWAHISTSWQTD